MKIVRNKIFETNSSSTHSFTLSEDKIQYQLPIHIHPDWEGEFGWDFETWRSKEEKLAYVLRCYMSLVDYKYSSNKDIYMGNLYRAFKPIQNRFKKIGITFDLPTYDEWKYGYVDHGNEYVEDLNYIYNNDENLLKFILNDNSYIEGGNDNC